MVNGWEFVTYTGFSLGVCCGNLIDSPELAMTVVSGVVCWDCPPELEDSNPCDGAIGSV